MIRRTMRNRVRCLNCHPIIFSAIGPSLNLLRLLLALDRSRVLSWLSQQPPAA